MKATMQLIARNRILIGDGLNQVKAIFDAGEQTERADEVAALAKEAGRRHAILCGLVFAAKDILLPSHFAWMQKIAGMDDREVADLCNSTAEGVE